MNLGYDLSIHFARVSGSIKIIGKDFPDSSSCHCIVDVQWHP